MPTLSVSRLGPSRATADTLRAASKLEQPNVRVRQTDITRFGAVSMAQGASGSKMPSSVTLTLNNSAGVATKEYKIGDYANLIEDILGRTIADADASSGGSVGGLNYSFGVAPVTVKAMNYSSTSGAVQFPQRLQYAVADVNGMIDVQPINPTEFVRNNAYNPNLLTMEFGDQFTLDWNRAFLITAGIGQTVSVTLMFGAAAYR